MVKWIISVLHRVIENIVRIDMRILVYVVVCMVDMTELSKSFKGP